MRIKSKIKVRRKLFLSLSFPQREPKNRIQNKAACIFVEREQLTNRKKNSLELCLLQRDESNRKRRKDSIIIISFRLSKSKIFLNGHYYLFIVRKEEKIESNPKDFR